MQHCTDSGAHVGDCCGSGGGGGQQHCSAVNTSRKSINYICRLLEREIGVTTRGRCKSDGGGCGHNVQCFHRPLLSGTTKQHHKHTFKRFACFAHPKPLWLCANVALLLAAKRHLRPSMANCFNIESKSPFLQAAISFGEKTMWTRNVHHQINHHHQCTVYLQRE